MTPPIRAVLPALIPRRRLYLSTAVVAARLGVTPRTVRLWAESCQIPAVKVGRQWRIEEAGFEEWLSYQHHTVSLNGNSGNNGNDSGVS